MCGYGVLPRSTLSDLHNMLYLVFLKHKRVWIFGILKALNQGLWTSNMTSFIIFWWKDLVTVPMVNWRKESRELAASGAVGKPLVKTMESCSKMGMLEMEGLGRCFPVRATQIGAWLEVGGKRGRNPGWVSCFQLVRVDRWWAIHHKSKSRMIRVRELKL